MAEVVKDDQLKAGRPTNMIGILILTLTAGLALSKPQFFPPLLPVNIAPTINIQNCQQSQCNANNGGGFPGFGFPGIPGFGRRKRSANLNKNV